MFGKNFEMNNAHDNVDRQVKRYQDLAAHAMDSHDRQGAVYFYLLAFHASRLSESSHSSDSQAHDRTGADGKSSFTHRHVLNVRDERVIDGLRTAFKIATEMKDRALAEHVFSFLEPFEDAASVNKATQTLQSLALDRLEELGLERNDMVRASDAVLDSIEGISSRKGKTPSNGRSNVGKDAHSNATSEGSMAKEATKDAASANAEAETGAKRHAASSSSTSSSDSMSKIIAALSGDDASSGEGDAEDSPRVTYATLAGYSRAIKQMKRFGIGMDENPKLKGFMDMLARRHGLDAPIHTSTILFRSYAHEDAKQFMIATANELDHPLIHMFMSRSPQGDPILCTTASQDLMSDDALLHTGVLSHGTVMLEGIDAWGEPLLPDEDEDDESESGRMARGVRAVVDFIRSAVENPYVSVLASCSSESDMGDFFYDLLEPLDIVDIQLPDANERRDIWDDIVARHPSIGMLDKSHLVKITRHMPRDDIYRAAAEAVSQAYDESLSNHRFVAVSFDNLANKIAAFQPLESDEYKQIEEEAIEQLRSDIDEYDHASHAKGTNSTDGSSSDTSSRTLGESPEPHGNDED